MGKIRLDHTKQSFLYINSDQILVICIAQPNHEGNNIQTEDSPTFIKPREETGHVHVTTGPVPTKSTGRPMVTQPLQSQQLEDDPLQHVTKEASCPVLFALGMLCSSLSCNGNELSSAVTGLGHRKCSNKRKREGEHPQQFPSGPEDEFTHKIHFLNLAFPETP